MTITPVASRRSVLVSGASRGIGSAIALRLALSGYAVTVHYVADRQGAESVVTQAMDAGGTARIIQFDVADRAAAQAALTSAMEQHGAFWGVVLNAGIARDNAFPSLSENDWDAVLSTNLDGFYYVLHPLVMPMIRLRDETPDYGQLRSAGADRDVDDGRIAARRNPGFHTDAAPWNA